MTPLSRALFESPIAPAPGDRAIPDSSLAPTAAVSPTRASRSTTVCSRSLKRYPSADHRIAARSTSAGAACPASSGALSSRRRGPSWCSQTRRWIVASGPAGRGQPVSGTGASARRSWM
jgi:hypothetical protein